MGLVVALNDGVKDKKLSDNSVHESETVRAITSILTDVSALVDSIPPVENAASRFGNPAFRTLYQEIKAQSRHYQERIPGLQAMRGSECDAIGEVKVYFEECWGNGERIDYGSGMELNFLCWM